MGRDLKRTREESERVQNELEEEKARVKAAEASKAQAEASLEFHKKSARLNKKEFEEVNGMLRNLEEQYAKLRSECYSLKEQGFSQQRAYQERCDQIRFLLDKIQTGLIQIEDIRDQTRNVLPCVAPFDKRLLPVSAFLDGTISKCNEALAYFQQFVGKERY